jgi:small subunit ribosomal protein S1
LVDWKGITGFVPVSHLDDLPNGLKEEELREKLALRVGQPLRLKIIEVEPERGRFVLSQRALGWDEDPQGLLESLIPGEVRRGQVTRLCDFGAFVDLGGFDGLLHISELSWRHVEHPGEVLEVGQETDVYILDVDRERKRVALSLKRLKPDPWSLAAEKYEVDQIVEGVVTNVVDFGAFVRVEDGVEGLIHISELAEGNFLHPHSVVQEGDVVKARILNIDPIRRRMGLSLRQA